MAKGVYGLPGLRISGKLAGTAIVPMRDGRVVIRELPDRLPPRTPNQRVTAGRFRGVAAAWRGLSLAEVEAWRRYATSLGKQPYQAFTALAAKCLQMRPDAPVPSLPPTTGFLGDGIQVTIATSPSFRSGERKGAGDGEQSGTRSALSPQPPLSRAKEGESGIVFSASGPNAAGVTTELLLQKLKSRARMPVAKDYRTHSFVAFAAGSLESTVPVEPGAYACAIRFVREATGQETALVPLGLVEVGGVA